MIKKSIVAKSVVAPKSAQTTKITAVTPATLAAPMPFRGVAYL